MDIRWPPARPTPLAAVGLGLLLSLGAPAAHAAGPSVRINELLAGLNGDSSVQFLELVAQGDSEKLWHAGEHRGEHGGEHRGDPVGRVMVVFFDATGVQTGRYVVPHDPGPLSNTILFATEAFADLTGITPDFVIPPSVMPLAGKVCFRSNPDSSASQSVDLCLSYGGDAFTGNTDGAGSAHPAELAILGSQSLSRATNFSFGAASNSNGDFALATPTPSSTLHDASGAEENALGEVLLPATAPLSEQGRNLFEKETFLGNGRTCSTCHVEAHGFGLTPDLVDALPPTDLLFLNELNVNTLVVGSAGSASPGAASQTTQPSDFVRASTLTGNLGGQAVVLAGSGDTYLVLGGASLDLPGNLISDGFGNAGTLVSFAAGDLDGPAPTGDPVGLEDTTLLTGGRALITANVNGFDQLSFRRAAPSLLNLKHTAPYGLSATVADLRAFSDAAVRQHLPRRLERVAGTDFRVPTTDELAAMEAFLTTILLPADESFDEANDFDRFVTTEAQKLGRDLFFGAAKCSVCHAGKVLASSDGRFGTTPGVNESFNTGVVELAINTADGLPTEQDTGQPANSRTFSTPPLFGVKLTAPYFHDNSVATLLEAVQFYASAAFRGSPAAARVGDIDAVTNAQNADYIAAFLDGLVDLPFTFTRSLAFGPQPVADGPSEAMELTITNTGARPLTIDVVELNGGYPVQFSHQAADPDAGPFANGQARAIGVTFDPTSVGAQVATVELRLSDGSEHWDVGVALSGTGSAPELSLTTLALEFGDQPTMAGPTAPQIVTLSNTGSAALDIASVSLVSLVGTDGGELLIAGDTGEATLQPAASRTVSVAFDPSSTGSKSAALRIVSNDPDQGLVEVLLSGNGACDPVVNLKDETFDAEATFEACLNITTEQVSVVAGGALTLRAGSKITLSSGFSVAPNATFVAEIDPALQH